MTPVRGAFPSPPRPIACAILLASCLACERAGDSPPADSADAPAVSGSAQSSAASSWIPALGSMLVVPLDSASGVVLYPESPSSDLVASGPVKFVDGSGAARDGGVALAESDSAVCGEAAVVRMADSTSWSAGFLAPSVSAVRLDSMDAFGAADSARTVAELSRLASTVPMRTDSPFQGLPFVVLSARRMEVPGRQVHFGHLMRRLPQEAAPLEEHTLIIAERRAAQPAAPMTSVVHLRSEGAEDVAEQYDVLAAMHDGARVWVLLARESDARTLYQIMERMADGRWIVRWSRALSC